MQLANKTLFRTNFSVYHQDNAYSETADYEPACHAYFDCQKERSPCPNLSPLRGMHGLLFILYLSRNCADDISSLSLPGGLSKFISSDAQATQEINVRPAKSVGRQNSTDTVEEPTLRPGALTDVTSPSLASHLNSKPEKDHELVDQNLNPTNVSATTPRKPANFPAPPSLKANASEQQALKCRKPFQSPRVRSANQLLQFSTDNQPDATHSDIGQQSGSILAEDVPPGNLPNDIQMPNSIDTHVEETQSQQLQTEHQPENNESLEGKNQVMEESVMLHQETPKKLIEVPENGNAKQQAQRDKDPNQSRDDNQDVLKLSAHETDDLHFLDDYPETELVHAFTEAPSQGLPSFGNTTSHIERTQELTETEDMQIKNVDSSKVSKEPVHASDSKDKKKSSDPKHHMPKPHGDINLHAEAQKQQDAKKQQDTNSLIAANADVGFELPEAMIYDTVDTDAENAKVVEQLLWLLKTKIVI